MKKFLNHFKIYLLLAVLSGCTDNMNEIREETISDVPLNVSGIPANNCVSTFFDWENQSTVQLQGGGLISLPWASGNTNGIVTHYGLDVIYDHKSSEGWELLYNLFEPCDFSNPKRLLVFYNKYRGVLRTYYYYNGTQTSNKTSFGVSLVGASNSALNFANKLIGKPMDDRSINPSFMEITPQEVTNDHWYFFDVEMAYDPNIKNLNHSSLQLLLKSRGSTHQNITLSGTQSGSLKGNINLAGSKSSLLDLNTLNLGANNSTTITSSFSVNSNVNQQEGVLNTKGNNQISNSVGAGIKNGINSLAADLGKNAINWISNPLKGIFSSLVGSSSSSNLNYVDLTMDTKINLSGSITHQQLLFEAAMKLPGTNANGVLGVLPSSDVPLGVWNINTTPIVEWDDEVHWFNGQQPFALMYNGRRDMLHSYRIKNNSFNVVINPDADVTLLETKSEIYVLNEFYEPGAMLPPIPDGVAAIQIDTEPSKQKWVGTHNTIGIEDRNSWVEPWMTLQRNIPDSRVYVKVTIKVQPNNGGNPIYLMKTFKPNFVKIDQYPDQYYGNNPDNGGGF